VAEDEVQIDSEQACQEAFHSAKHNGSGGVTVEDMLQHILSLDGAHRPKGLRTVSAWKESEMRKGLEQCANNDGLLVYDEFGSWWRTWDF